jgi:hypothetical protein
MDVVRERDERRREGDARSDEDADGEGEAVARAHFRDAGTAPGGGDRRRLAMGRREHHASGL